MNQNLFIGTYSKTGVYKFNFTNGNLNKLEEESSFENCSYLCSSNNMLYSIVEYSNNLLYKNGYIIARNHNLFPINSSPLIGNGPCFITLDKTRNVLYVGNYGDGSIDIFSLNTDGSINTEFYHKAPCSSISKIHYISISSNNKFLFAIDLGIDMLIAYEIISNGINFELKEFCSHKFPNNSAPRHLVNLNSVLYVITENSCELYQFEFSEINGFKIINTISLLPTNTIVNANTTGCAIKISKDHKFIYTSIRGHNSISVFKIGLSLELIQNISCFGITPRDIFLDNTETFLLCANQNSNSISIFNRDIKTGYLNLKNIYPIDSPACII